MAAKRNNIGDKLVRDLGALEKLKAAIIQHKEAGERFAAVYGPQLSHAPWRDLYNVGNDFVARGRAVLSIEDRWLGEIVGLLKERGWLDNTTIVVTGDHGVRNRTEDPTFAPGFIDDYSFHVPLVVFAPKALSTRVDIATMTSHIDISPTVLDLLGVSQGRDFEQGLTIWDPRIAQRRTFFEAGGLFGANGYHFDKEFYMNQIFADAIYRNTAMHFTTSNMVPPQSAQYSEIKRNFSAFDALESRWSSIALDAADSQKLQQTGNFSAR